MIVINFPIILGVVTMCNHVDVINDWGEIVQDCNPPKNITEVLFHRGSK